MQGISWPSFATSLHNLTVRNKIAIMLTVEEQKYNNKITVNDCY